MAVPIDFLVNSPHESSDEDFSEYEISYSSEDESMEDEPSEDINGGSLSSLEQEQGTYITLTLSLSLSISVFTVFPHS